jgi:hypothetical protein
MRSWKHTRTVIQPRASWGKRHRKASATKWNINAGAGEEALYRAGIFKAGTSRRAIARALTRGRPRPILVATGKIKAKTRVITFKRRRLRRGRYVLAIRMRASMNPARASLLLSPVIRVGVR